jgi:hypothetical protein
MYQKTFATIYPIFSEQFVHIPCASAHAGDHAKKKLPDISRVRFLVDNIFLCTPFYKSHEAAE